MPPMDADPKEYDAKSLAFHKLEGIDGVKLQTDSTTFEDRGICKVGFGWSASQLVS